MLRSLVGSEMCIRDRNKELSMSKAIKKMIEGRLSYPDGSYIFYKKRFGENKEKPGVIFCLGYCSSLDSNKSRFVDEFCEMNRLSCLRFNYMGHEHSSGTIFEATLSSWKQNFLDVMDKLSEGNKCNVFPLF